MSDKKIKLDDETVCKYGITKLAEEQGQLDSECETPATRRVVCPGPTPSCLAALEFCEEHYQALMEWEKNQ